MSKKPSKKQPRKPRSQPAPPRRWRRRLFPVLLVLTGLALAYGAYLDWQVRSQFEGKRWALPAHVYARPLELFEGRALRPEQLDAELELLNYRRLAGAGAPGSYERRGERYLVTTRSFAFPDGTEPSRALSLVLRDGRVAELRDRAGAAADLVRLDPAQIGSIYPAHKEDRILVRLQDVPEELKTALLAVEDRDFYQHHGLSFSGIARALLANLKAGRVVQGGSTITQQLVKNFYLSNERSLWRKANEAAMAVLLDFHYGKDEILEAYFNEVYLGQDRQRAIHGFGLASQFYFGRPLQELGLPELALLAGLVKGPSYYDPRAHAERALERRNLVLQVLADTGAVSTQRAAAAQRAPLGVLPRGRAGDGRYPAFMDLVKQHLRRDYRPEDLSSEGLRIFTTLDPWAQRAAEQALQQRLARFSDQELQGAVVAVDDQGGVLALVGGRDPRFPGFNRALDARRPVGSLLKPAVYLAALEDPARYGLGTLLSDEAITLEDETGKPWSPHNYDREAHGRVPLWQALAHSYNLATVRLGLEVGLERVADSMQRLGLQPPRRVYPSLLLGASGYTPLEMAQMYQTLASGGFRSPLRSVRTVLRHDGEVLSRYPLTVERAFDPAPVYLVRHALIAVTREGTGRGIATWLGERLAAGKTGTTDDLRDSWFAGYTGDTVAVVWLGRDDNGKTGLTGASGALTVWADLIARLDTRELDPTPPEGIETLWVDPGSGLPTERHCRGAAALPYRTGYAPTGKAECVDERGLLRRSGDWLKGVFE